MSSSSLLLRPTLLAAGIAMLGLAAALPASAQENHGEQSSEYALPAAPLASTLSRIAADAGLVLSIDPQLTRGRTSQPVQGQLSPEQALRQALSGSGLILVPGASGSYSLQALDSGNALLLDDVDISGRLRTQDGSEASGYRSEDLKNVGALGGMALRDTPYSISVYSSDLVRNIQATSLDDIFKLNPSTQFTSPTTAGYASSLSVRGFSASGNLNVANDGLRFSNSSNSGNAIEEMERLEVVTGLSGFLYGPGTPGALLNYVLKRPTTERYNSVTLGNAGGESYYLHGDFGGKIDEQGVFAYRLNVLSQDGETAIDLQKRRRQLVSLALDWNVSDDLLVQFDASWKKNQTRGLTSYWFFSNHAHRPDASDLDNDKLYSQRWSFADSEHKRVGGRFQWKLDDIFSLRGALAYDLNETQYAYTGPTVSSAGVYGQPLYAFAPVEQEETSTYLFLDAAFDTAGIGHKVTTGYQGNIARERNYTDYIDTRFQYTSVVGNRPFNERPQVAKPAYSVGHGDQHLSERSQSDNLLIGDVITFNEQWSSILGVTRTRIKSFSDNFVWVGTSGSKPAIKRYNESKTSPNVSLVYKPQPWLTTYVTYIEALQAGGIAPDAALNKGQSLAPFISEQYEIGIKAALGETLLTAALFNIDKPNALQNAQGYYVQDGRQENNGLELGLTGKVTPALTLISGITLLDPEVKKAAKAEHEGQKPVSVATQLAKLYAEYDLGAVPGLTLTGGAYYTGKQYADEANQHSLPSFTTFDAGARYRLPLADNDLTLRANISNLTDKEYWLSRHYLGAPRTLTFSAQLEF
ncbi:TonB-dependent siderophore receptor [Pseudomonas sp. ABC1]|uniref:TonB-dependent receptor n=1 Tax=Pseudomonas sp. ABC1 TaxID=2748080 RepID=UPI0015C3F39E|nr:TonB-dependent receptor [Pseudomonas sp. ABC1]QLF93996.1 TonB-dependent siderophore receptor [Pseudomonas sp. ABC1]